MATAELEGPATWRVHDLLVPRHPLDHLARHGSGVRLAADGTDGGGAARVA